nr:LysM peptidoglycan-binding domain-containing protein [Massilia glaciei]
MSRVYEVVEGDTLSLIAVAFGVNVRALVKLNCINSPISIRKGQKLRIPDAEEIPMTPFDLKHKPIQIDFSRLLALEFFDAANMPISGMNVAIHLDGKVEKYKTDANGKIPHITSDEKTVVQVHVEKTNLDWKKISEIQLENEATFARLISPKIKLQSTMKVHNGPAQTARTDKPEPQAVATETLTRSANGNPVHKIAMECPNQENLKLGTNFKYRDIIIAAGKRSGFSPQAIAAIMNAEAATLTVIEYIPKINKKTKLPILGKDGKVLMKKLLRNDGEWDVNSASPASSARGMTQFLDGSWIAQAVIDGSFVNSRAKKEGWLTIRKIAVKQKKNSVEKQVIEFKLTDGNFVTATKKHTLAQVLIAKHLTSRATSNDENLQKLLDLRYEAEYSIHAAVDYGTQNLDGLRDKEFRIDDLNDGDKAKLVYLTHHLGLGDGKSFINNTMGEATAKNLLITQIGDEAAAIRAANEGGEYVKAHRKWLFGFIDMKIDLPAKMCDKSKAEPARSLLAITEAIRPA